MVEIGVAGVEMGDEPLARSGSRLDAQRAALAPRVRVGKTYCEKALVLDPIQHCPSHHHWIEVEDIIVRAGGTVDPPPKAGTQCTATATGMDALTGDKAALNCTGIARRVYGGTP